jgi:hypothetical protein
MVLDARKACRHRATRSQLRVTLGRRQGSSGLFLSFLNRFTYFLNRRSPLEVFLFPGGFNIFRPTVGPERTVTVKAKYLYGIPDSRFKIMIPDPDPEGS